MLESFASWIVFALAYLVFFGKETHGLSKTRYVSHKNCNNLNRGKIIPHPVNCSQYITCNGLRSTVGECPDGLFYNSDMISCDKNKSQCPVKEIEVVVKPTTPSNNKVTFKITTQPPKLQEVTTEQPLSTVSVLPLYADGRPLCSLWQDMKFPHPYNCAYYYQCFKGFLTIQRCYFGYLWDWMKQRCLPENVAQCHSEDDKHLQ